MTQHKHSSAYSGQESPEEKLTKISNALEETLALLGREDLSSIFDGYKPKFSKTPKKAPLDQKVAISVNSEEKDSFMRELESLENSGVTISMSQYIRNKALGTIDIEDWRGKAEKCLKDIENTKSQSKGMSSRKIEIIAALEEEEDEDIIKDLEEELYNLNKKVDQTKAVKLNRSIRLSGRMSFQEFETIKHRASKLCLNYSDYLRMLIFDLEPGTTGDAHLSYDAKRRFYISIVNVSENGWGEPSSLYNCPQCSNYLEQIEELESRNKALVEALKKPR